MVIRSGNETQALVLAHDSLAPPFKQILQRDGPD